MFQTRLKELREAAGYRSQQAFADAFGVAQSTVGGWESGQRKPNQETTLRLAAFFGVTVGYLLGTENKKAPAENDGGEDPINGDPELTAYLEELRTRPEMRMLFSVTKNATKADVETAVSNNIRSAREAAGLSQKQVALELRVSAPTVSDWEKGKIYPSALNLIALSRLLDATTDYLLGIVETKKTPALSAEVEEIVEGYNTLDEYGKLAVKEILRVEAQRCEAVQR